MIDHDQLFKEMVQQFLGEFFELFYPEWTARFDFSRVEWLNQDIFPDPPDGERRSIDLLAKLPLRPLPGESQGRGEIEKWIALIHIELESGTHIGAFRRRMFWYHVFVGHKHQLPVLPLALFQQMGLEGLGEDEYVEAFGSMEITRFRYLYVGLPSLRAEDYVNRPNPLAPGLVSLMNCPEDLKAWLKAEAARRIATDGTTPQQKHLLWNCLERYMTLTETQETEYEQLLQQPEYPEARAMAVTTFEKGIEKGIEKGRLEALRRAALAVMERRFAPVPAELQEAVLRKSANELEDLIPLLATAGNLDEVEL